MFLYKKAFERTGTVQSERSGIPALDSGLKSFSSPTYLTKSVRFLVVNKKDIIKKSPDGRTTVRILTTQWGWDELSGLTASGMTLAPGKSKLTYDGNIYRLTELDNFGRKYDNPFQAIGVVKAIFERERPRVN